MKTEVPFIPIGFYDRASTIVLDVAVLDAALDDN